MPSPINGIEDRVLKGSATYFECLKFGSQKSTVDGVEKEKVMFLLEERSDFSPQKKIVSVFIKYVVLVFLLRFLNMKHEVNPQMRLH